jgi:uncharacterized protein YjdB
MKNLLNLTLKLASALALAFSLALAACSSGGGDDKPAGDGVTGVTLSQSSMALTVGGAPGTLTAAVQPASAAQGVTWSSSAQGVASVQGSGATVTISPVSAGAATITARSDADPSKTAACQVTVTAAGPKPVESVGVEPTALVLYVGDPPRTLAATVLPADAANKAVTWTNSNQAAVAMTESGATAVVAPVAPGSATITVASEADPSKAATCAVTVMGPLEPETAAYIAGRFGLYRNGRFDWSIGWQELLDVFVDGQDNIHAVGWYHDLAGGWGTGFEWSPAHYRNGALTILPLTAAGAFEGCASGVWVAGADVYVAGYELTGSPSAYTAVARLWKNGQQQVLEGAGGAGGAAETVAYKVCVFNGDAYVAGGARDAQGAERPAIWKNGALHMFAESNAPIIDMGMAGDGTIYCLLDNAEVRTTPASAPSALSAPLAMDGSGTHLHLAVDGADWYVAGWHGDEACYWKNGVMADIEHPALYRWVEAEDIFAHDGRLYIAGRMAGAGDFNFTYYVGLWIDGAFVGDDRAIADSWGELYDTYPAAVFVRTAPPIPVLGLSLSEAALDVPLGYARTLTAAMEPANATDKTIAWTSSAPAVAEIVGNGFSVAVMGRAVGQATITAAVGGVTATCAIDVKTVAVDGVLLPAALSVGKGRQVGVTAVIMPSEATDKRVAWTSSNPAVAEATGTGPNGTVRGAGTGVATITATTLDGGKTATCQVTVAEPTRPAIYVAGQFGLFIDGVWNAAIGPQRLHDVFADAEGHVHAAGYHHDPARDVEWAAAHYLDGAPTILEMTHGQGDLVSVAYGVSVAAGGDVYVAGVEAFSGGPYGHGEAARLWKNGAQQHLEGVDESGAVYSWAQAVLAVGDDVYVVGYDYDADIYPCIWKNGARTVYPGMNASSKLRLGFIDIAAATEGPYSGHLYVMTYNYYYDDESDNAVYRIDPDNIEAAPVRVMGGDQTYDRFLFHLAVEGADVYASGWKPQQQGPHYWKNGDEHPLSLPDGDIYWIEADDVYALDGHAYVAGYYSDGEVLRVVQWMDGALLTDDRVIPFVGDGYQGTVPWAIFVQR